MQHNAIKLSKAKQHHTNTKQPRHPQALFIDGVQRAAAEVPLTLWSSHEHGPRFRKPPTMDAALKVCASAGGGGRGGKIT